MSRDVKFHEDIFSFLGKPQEEIMDMFASTSLLRVYEHKYNQSPTPNTSSTASPTPIIIEDAAADNTKGNLTELENPLHTFKISIAIS